MIKIKRHIVSAALAACLLTSQAAQNVKSFLNVYDLDTKKTVVVKEFDRRMEAPNWTPDGGELVYNDGGKLYRIPVGGGEPVLIPSGSARGCNNDHVISSDGKWVAFSNDDRGGSRIYVMPFPAGGEPRLVTEKGPSYLHGWTPDMKTLAYTAKREGDKHFNIYSISDDGSNESRLTSTDALDDGSEYSADGKSIWFNSSRTGVMQVWRMNPDGSGQTQATFDKTRHAWFPHVSPDGKSLVYMAYKVGDVDPDAHPPYKDVEILLMDPEGGAPRVLLSFFGGQGSFNVNSWAPDSRKFAYVSYGRPE